MVNSSPLIRADKPAAPLTPVTTWKSVRPGKEYEGDRPGRWNRDFLRWRGDLCKQQATFIKAFSSHGNSSPVPSPFSSPSRPVPSPALSAATCRHGPPLATFMPKTGVQFARGACERGMHRVRACVLGQGTRERERERPSPGHSRVSRTLSHSCIVPRQELPVAYWMCAAEHTAEIPLVCLSAVSVAYRNPVSRFRVGRLLCSQT